MFSEDTRFWICFTFLLVLFSLQPLEINIITSNYILQVAKPSVPFLNHVMRN